MVRAQLGNETGLAAVDKPDEGSLAAITADGANNFTVSAADLRNFRVGMSIDLVNKTTGAVLAAGRTVTALDNVANTVTYSGGDLATVPGTTQVYIPGGWELAAPVGAFAREDNVNINGGPGIMAGFNGAGVFTTIQGMRERLKAISATTYSDTEMDKMTYNDLVYALRVNDYPGSIK